MKHLSWLFVLLLVATVTNYPNPFNPHGGEVTTIECTADTTTEAFLYIFDLGARLMLRQAFNLTGGSASRATWNGYSDYNEKAGNGVYPYWIISKANERIGKGKIWVINQ